MGAADFYDVIPGLGFFEEFRIQQFQGWYESAGDFLPGSDMKSAGDDVIAGLATIHMVVGMNLLLSAKEFFRTATDHFVRIHVERSPRAGLKNIDDEFAVPISV